MHLLVFGGWGQLGSDLALAARGRHEMVRPRRDEVDVTDAGAVSAFVADRRPDVVVNAAAFHRVDECETDPLRAFAVNALGALNAARAARGTGARCVYISTDYVFDGSRRQGYAEDDPVAPLNVYGVSKAAGERLVCTACPDSLVVRGSGMFGQAGSSGKGGNFIETMLAKAAAGEPIRVVDDQVFAPTSTLDLAERLVLLLERSVPSGIYHLANAGACSWYELAGATLRLARVKAELSPQATGSEGVRRPRYSVLLDTKTARLGFPAARSWEEALASYLARRVPRAAAGAAHVGAREDPGGS
jgi:dTDP-4-dehydrorhamnose reductase